MVPGENWGRGRKEVTRGGRGEFGLWLKISVSLGPDYLASGMKKLSP